MVIKKYFLCVVAAVCLFAHDSSYAQCNTTKNGTEQHQEQISCIQSELGVVAVANVAALTIMLSAWHLVNFVFGRCAETPSKAE